MNVSTANVVSCVFLSLAAQWTDSHTHVKAHYSRNQAVKQNVCSNPEFLGLYTVTY